MNVVAYGAIRALSSSSRLGSAFLQKDLELLPSASGSVLGKLVNKFESSLYSSKWEYY